jgi:hypothetical protein
MPSARTSARVAAREDCGAGLRPLARCLQPLRERLRLYLLRRIGSRKTEASVKVRRLSCARFRQEGVYKGRKPSIDVAKVKTLRESGMGPAAIAKQLNMARSSVYRALGM